MKRKKWVTLKTTFHNHNYKNQKYEDSHAMAGLQRGMGGIWSFAIHSNSFPEPKYHVYDLRHPRMQNVCRALNCLTNGTISLPFNYFISFYS